MAVNLSALQFLRGDIVASVEAALQQSGLAPQYLELELTESILIQNTAKVLAITQRLSALGVQLSIDDFGTGYSSLSYLKRLKVDKLKIDQSFVRDLASDADSSAITGTIIQLAHSLGLRSIAEGVENQQVQAILQSMGCDEVQGYAIARPMPAPAFADFVANHIEATCVC